MTDDRLNKIREAMCSIILHGGHVGAYVSPRDVLELLDMIDRLREEAESRNEYTVGDLV